MPVDFDGIADIINFADNAIYDDLTLKSIFVRVTADGDGSSGVDRFLAKSPAAAVTGWSLIHQAAVDRFEFVQTSDGGGLTVGRWATTNGTFSNGVPYSFGVSMDIGNINNDPILYQDGAEDTNEITASVGNFTTDAGDGLAVGAFDGGAPAAFFNGKISDIHIANVIWTAEEFASLHASNAPGYWMRGLIFYAQMNGAAGLQEFDGASLGAANKVVDQINGILGTPTSNPLGVADTILAV